MSDNVVRIGRGVRSLKTAPEFDGYTKVVINLNENYAYTAGTDEGRTLTLDNPWGTQDMAKNILSSIRGFQYQPYSVPGAILDPAAELGDGMVANNVYGGIYRKKTIFGRDFRADISAPGDEEINHEFPYHSKQDRKVSRQLANLTSELNIQADKISAKVSRTGGDGSSFGWDLLDDSWCVHSNGIDILKAAKGGVEVYGKITATSGKIGGFDIMSDYLSTNDMTWGGTNTVGVYVGNKGIQLGKTLKMHPSGYFEAAEGKFSGTVTAGKIAYGGNDGYFPGGGISSGSILGNRLVGNTITTAYTSGGINTSLGYADFANSVFTGINSVGSLKVTGTFHLFGYRVGMKSAAVATPGGGSTTLYYLTYSEV